MGVHVGRNGHTRRWMGQETQTRRSATQQKIKGRQFNMPSNVCKQSVKKYVTRVIKQKDTTTNAASKTVLTKHKPTGPSIPSTQPSSLTNTTISLGRVTHSLSLTPSSRWSTAHSPSQDTPAPPFTPPGHSIICNQST